MPNQQETFEDIVARTLCDDYLRLSESNNDLLDFYDDLLTTNETERRSQ